MLKRVISGGQSGADLGGVKAAKAAGKAVGGTMPKGFRTLDGPRPQYAVEYGMEEHSSEAYPPRTYKNAKESDGTIRFAVNMESSGERCTLKAITQYGKPHFDVHIKDVAEFSLPEDEHPKAAAKWIRDKGIEVLNVAGNSEKTAPGMEEFVVRYMTALFRELEEE